MQTEEREKFKLEETNTDSTSNGSGQSEEREKWGKKIEFLLSLLGYIVGLGNLWRFPYVCMRNGGGAFLIPFVVCIILLAFPIFFLEVSLGQFTARSVVHCWEACPLFKGVGIGMVFVNGLCCVYYVMVVTWTLYYIGNSFVSPLPWTTCDNWWNTDDCHADADKLLPNGDAAYNFTNKTLNMSTIAGISNITHDKVSSEEEFWQYNVLHISSGVEEMGSLNVNILLCLMAAWFIIFLCLMKGVKSVGKVVYVTATMPYILLTVLLVRGVTLPGASDGILFFITPNFSRILSFQVWTEAAIQVFYSTCISWGPLITMASYNKFKNNCLGDTILLLTLGEGTSVLGGFVVFSILGFMAHTSGLDIAEVAKSGPGLVYVAYPEAVSRLPLSNLWAVLFFLMVLTIGLDTEFGTAEPLIAVFADSFQYFRRRRVLFTAVILTICCIMGIPLCLRGGIYLFQLFDWYVAAFCIPFFALSECLVFGWIYGAENFSRDIQLMIGRPVPTFIRIQWCIITPVLLLILLGITVFTYTLPTYGSYTYPTTANVFGMIFAIIPIIPIPVFAFIEIQKASGSTIMEKLKNAMKPTSNWRPGHEGVNKSYIDNNTYFNSSFMKKFRMNILSE